MGKTAPITSLIDFKICDTYIENFAGKQEKFFFFRFFSPNLTIATELEIQSEIYKLQRACDTLSRDLNFLMMDKIEDLTENKRYWDHQAPQFLPYTTEILNSITNTEATSAAVQKAYYIVVAERDLDKVQEIYNVLSGLDFDCYLAEKRELALIMRNFLLREFFDYDILMVENELSEEYEKKTVRQKAKISQESFFRSELTKRLTPNRIDPHPRWIEQNDFLRKTILVKNIPTSSGSCRFKEIAQLRNTTMMIRISPMSKFLASKLVNSQVNAQLTRKSKKQYTEQKEAEKEVERIDEFYNKILEDQNAIFYTNIYIETYGKERQDLTKNLDLLFGYLKGRGMTYEILNYQQTEGFLGVYPLGHDTFKNIANNVPSNSLAAFYPFSYSGRNDPAGFPLGKTIDGGNMFVDFWQWAGSITNGNFSITGQSGQGKSWLMKKILSFLIMTNTRCFVFDPENEYMQEIRELGGTVYDCTDGRVRINPFEVRRLRRDDDNDTLLDEPEAFRHKQMFYQHLSWLKDFHRVLFPSITAPELDALMILIRDVYRMKGITDSSDFDNLPPESYITYTDIYEFIYQQAEHYNEENPRYLMIPKQIMQQLLLTLADCYDGSMAFLFNGTTNIPNTSGSIDFSLQTLLAGSEQRTQAVMFNLMTYVWNIVSLKQGKVCIAADELHAMIVNPVVAAYFKDFATRARKYDTIIGVSTQNIAGLMVEKIKYIAISIFSNMAFQFIFYPGAVDLENTRTLLQLTDGEVQRISVSNRTYCLLKAGKDKYYMKVGKFPYEERLFGTAGGR